MGGSQDDQFDKGLNRRKANASSTLAGVEELSYEQKCAEAQTSFNRQVAGSFLDEQEKWRLRDVGRVFVSNLKGVEFCALAFPGSSWTTERVLEYRRAVCLLWATFFAALGSNHIEMKRFPIDASISDPQKCYGGYLIAKDESSKWVQALYYGAVAYQLVGDWTGRTYNCQRFIPGIGSINDLSRGEYKSLLNQAIRDARQHGMSIGEEIILQTAVPLFRNILNLRLRKTL